MSKTKRLFYHDFQEHDHIDADCGEDQVGIQIVKSFQTGDCPNCNGHFEKFTNHFPKSARIEDRFFDSRIILFFCRNCGWWQCKQVTDLDKEKGIVSTYAYQYHSILESIDISSNDIKIRDLKKHLSNNWSDKKFISASKAEDLIKDILKEHLSCDIFHTTSNVNTPDGGIDLFICHDNSKIKTAIQVKRRVNREVESLHEVRNFVGAMVIEDYQKGIFVTTAERFTKGTYGIPKKLAAAQSKLELQLIDGEKLLEILKSTTPSNPKLPLGIKDKTLWEGENKKNYLTYEIFREADF